ncbi:MAG: hypothetical protein AAFP19_11295 [Bacteroidota bacterium]
MQNTRLIGLFRLLSTKERRKFKEYIHSPFFNKNEKLQQLHDLLALQAPKFPAKQIEKRRLYQQLFPKSPYKELSLNNLISDLLQKLYEFLAHQKYTEKPHLQKSFQLEWLLEKDAYSHAEKELKRYRQLQDKNHYRNYDYYLQEYLFYERSDYYHVSHSNRKEEESLQLQSNHLDWYYFTNKMRLACDMASRNTVIKATYECRFLEDLIQKYECNKHQLQEMPALKVYYSIYQMLIHFEAEEYYRDLKALLPQYYRLFPQAELRTIYNYVLNYCIRKVNSGRSMYYRESLDLYKILLEQKTIFLNGYLTQWTYKNITTIAIRVKDYDWIESFIHDYKDALLPEERNNAFAYNSAALYHARKDYKRALLQLQDVEFTATSYYMGAKIIQVKSYYELAEFEALFALIEAFKKYLLRRREISDYRRKANNNFLNLVKRIVQLKSSRHTLRRLVLQQKVERLSERLQAMNPVANKDWLTEILQEI